MADSSYVKLIHAILDSLKEDNVSKKVCEDLAVSTLDKVVKTAWENSVSVRAEFGTFEDFKKHVIKNRLRTPDENGSRVIKSRYERDPVI